MEAEILSFISNQGLAVGVSIFLIWWVTTEVSKVLTAIADSLNHHDSRVTVLSTKVDKACDQIEQIHAAVVNK